MAKTTELEALYKATTYRVFLPGGICELRIGQPCETLRCWLETCGYTEFAIITAHNPGGQPVAAAQNAERQAELECELIEGNYEPYAGENVADDAAWPVEESCFVADIAAEDACALAEDFGQNAIVFGTADGVAQLLWIETE
ncbi:DUF3293 domain-containing protein [Quatrionicoccus australiensis]|uniref:DUF3293 domain-containing protein n=1 Tax=Quatrionicoccus australiensis TaxID=138118 RepID=UPI001CF8B4FA|nr:DUF3293 domain-containing protein [Quatrionicoccus australiensis]UCV13872.1 DUF3293 domain-containing protein [Quatrionicoccus australiensis]